MSDTRNAELEAALHDFEATASSFAARLIRMSEVRATYVRQIREMSQGIRAAVEAGELSPAKGAEMALSLTHEITGRNQRIPFFLFGAGKNRKPAFFVAETVVGVFSFGLAQGHAVMKEIRIRFQAKCCSKN